MKHPFHSTDRVIEHRYYIKRVVLFVIFAKINEMNCKNVSTKIVLQFRFERSECREVIISVMMCFVSIHIHKRAISGEEGVLKKCLTAPLYRLEIWRRWYWKGNFSSFLSSCSLLTCYKKLYEKPVKFMVGRYAYASFLIKSIFALSLSRKITILAHNLFRYRKDVM